MGKPTKKGRKPKTSTYQCEACAGYQNEPIVACDKCDKWYHFHCVGLKSIDPKDVWICDNCTTKDDLPTKSPQQVPENVRQKETSNSPNANRSDNNDEYALRYDLRHPYYQAHRREDLSPNNPTENRPIPRSQHVENVPNFASSTRSNRREIELEMLAEERTLSRLRDSEYLQKKYSILMNHKRRTEKGSTQKFDVHSDVRTEEWVAQQHQQKMSEKAATEVNKTYTFDAQDFSKRLDAIRLDSSTITRSPTKRNSRTMYRGINNLLQCEGCERVDEEEHFGACLLCCKPYHYSCMDVIMLDEHTKYICPMCKNVEHTRSRRSISSLTYPEVNKAKASEVVSKPKIDDIEGPYNQRSQQSPIQEQIPSRKSEKENKRQCNTCGSTTNQHELKPCDVCDQICHFRCMHLTSIDNKVIWVCTKCKEVQIKPVNQQANQDEAATTTTSPDGPKETTGASQTLTSAQIASRHVVTRDLPIFVGKPEQWPMFRSRFDNSTKLCGFSNSENLDRLQKCLKGNALEAVRSRLLTAESVPDIMSTLEMLYGRPELIVNSLMRKIRSEPPPKADKLNTLVDFALSVKNVCATLEQANLNFHLSNPALVQELVDKLPTNIKIEWAKFKATLVEVNLSTLGQFLYDLAKVISTVTEPTVSRESKDDGKPRTNFQKRDGSQKDSNRSDSAYVYSHQSQSNKRETTTKVKGSTEQSSDQCVICRKSCEKVEKCPEFIGYDIERRWKEMYNHKLCRKCLGKHGRFCYQSKQCGVNGCIFKHHTLLHDEKRHSSEPKSQQVGEARITNVHFSMLRNVLLRIVPVTLYYNAQQVDTFAYQDDVTMIENSLVRTLGITGTVEPLCLIWTADMHRKENNSLRIQVKISGRDQFLEKFVIRDARTVDTLSLPIQTIDKEKLMGCFPYLKDIPLIDYVNAIPRILIGSDNANLNVPQEIIEGNFNQPVACRSRIGWSLHGRTNDRRRTSELQVINIHRNKCPCQAQIDEQTHQMVKEHFAVENLGVQVTNNVQFCSKEKEERALNLLEKQTRRVGDRYETGLLWRYDDIKLPDSYRMAYKRLQCLEKHKPETIAVIDQTIKEYIQKGYAHKLTDGDIKNTPNLRVWYLPIFTVSNPKKPNKIRVVFDGAAKVDNISLNSLLLKGPDLLSSLVDILRRFREKSVAASGDITEMFPQIKIRREDVHAQRFLWRNGDKSKKPDQYVLDRMTFGANCSPASAQFVKNKNASQYEKIYPRAVEAIQKNHYVDDMLECQHTDEEMIRLIRQVKEIHSKAGFEIRKFLSNSGAVMKEVNDNYQDLQSSLDISNSLKDNFARRMEKQIGLGR